MQASAACGGAPQDPRQMGGNRWTAFAKEGGVSLTCFIQIRGESMKNIVNEKGN